MWIIVENTVILGIKSVLIESLDRHMSVPIEDHYYHKSTICSNREKEVARIKRLGYSKYI